MAAMRAISNLVPVYDANWGLRCGRNGGRMVAAAAVTSAYACK